MPLYRRCSASELAAGLVWRSQLKKTLNQALVYLLAGVLVLADQYTKHLVRTNLAINEMWNPWPALTPYFRVLHIQNTGAAFGLFKDGNLVFTIIAIVVSLVIIVYAQRVPPGNWLMRTALGMQLGGALGNLVDRLTFGTVTDFVSVGNFAIFNVADASISVGVAFLALLMFFEARAERRAAGSGSTLPGVDASEMQSGG